MTVANSGGLSNDFGAEKSVDLLDLGSHVGNEPHPIEAVRALENPDRLVAAGSVAIPLGTQRLGTGVALATQLICEDLRRSDGVRILGVRDADRREEGRGGDSEADGWLEVH